jgi:hypothetical protein
MGDPVRGMAGSVVESEEVQAGNQGVSPGKHEESMDAHALPHPFRVAEFRLLRLGVRELDPEPVLGLQTGNQEKTGYGRRQTGS